MAPKQQVSPDTWIKLGLYIASGVGIAFGVNYVLDFLKPSKKLEDQNKKDVKNELDAAKKAKPQSYPNSVYAGFASTIAEAIFGAGSDEDAIYDVFKQLKSDTDYLLLIQAWGTPTRQVFPDYFVFYSTGKKLTLPAALRYDLDSNEVKKINNILASKGIKYRI